MITRTDTRTVAVEWRTKFTKKQLIGLRWTGFSINDLGSIHSASIYAVGVLATVYAILPPWSFLRDLPKFIFKKFD